jgi:hypothetical protein
MNILMIVIIMQKLLQTFSILPFMNAANCIPCKSAHLSLHFPLTSTSFADVLSKLSDKQVTLRYYSHRTTICIPICSYPFPKQLSVCRILILQ